MHGDVNAKEGASPDHGEADEGCPVGAVHDAADHRMRMRLRLLRRFPQLALKSFLVELRHREILTDTGDRRQQKGDFSS